MTKTMRDALYQAFDNSVNTLAGHANLDKQMTEEEYRRFIDSAGDLMAAAQKFIITEDKK